ncbi:hypothetical protein [Sphingobium yanoikuyae]|uniref:hypothetical protein n=1 Tax=Sphingobium yanoikuyae TaxID=13690 RepID=UPI0028B1419F|nr:hypothetical protein [Sphingobium yanoikuyae]
MFVFPLHRFNPGIFAADVVAKVIDGGTAINGEKTVIQTDGGGRWEGSIGDIDLDDPYEKRLYEAWASHFAGGGRAFLMPVPSIDTAPAPFSGDKIAWPSDISDDDDFYPTSVGFATPWIEARLVGASALRATTVTIEVTRGSRLTPGMRFGAGGNRAYKIERIVSRDGQRATCIISSPLRAALADGSPLNFDWPLVQCTAVVGQNLTPEYSYGYASVSVSFVEDFTDA